MAKPLQELYAEVSARGITQTQQQLNSLDKAGAKAHGTMDLLRKGIQAFGAYHLLNAVKKIVNEFTNYAETISKVSEQTGISVTELQRLKYAADQSDVSFDALQNGLKFLTRNMFNVMQGSAQTEAVFKTLGVSVKNVDGSMRGAGEVFNDVQQAIAKIPDPTHRAAIAMELFGKQGGDVLPFITANADEVQRLKEEADQLGIVLEKSTIEKAKELGDQMDKTRDAITGVKFEIAQGLLPILNTLAGWVTTFLSAWRELWGGAMRQKIAEQEEAIRHYGEMLKVLHTQKRLHIITDDEFAQKLAALNAQYAQEIALINDVTKAVGAPDGEIDTTNRNNEAHSNLLKTLEKLTLVRHIERQETTEEYLTRMEELGKLQDAELAWRLKQEKLNADKEREELEEEQRKMRLTEVLHGMSGGYDLLTSMVKNNTLSFTEWASSASESIKIVTVKLLALIAAAKILERFGLGSAGSIFSGLSSIIGGFGFQDPRGDMWAMREGSDFGKMFMQGFDQHIGRLAGAATQPQQTILKIYAEPGIIVERMAGMPLSYKSKLARDVVEEGQRLRS